MFSHLKGVLIYLASYAATTCGVVDFSNIAVGSTTKSIGSSAVASSTLTADTTVAFSWFLDTTILLEAAVNPANGLVSCTQRSAIAFYCPATSTGTLFTNVTTPALTASNSQISIQRSGVLVKEITINVTVCAPIGGLVTSTFSDTPCGFQCQGTFTCPAKHVGNTTGTCQSNATWSVSPVCTKRSSGLDGGIIALIVILCLLAVGCIVVVVVLYKRKKACFADKGL